MRTMLEKKTIYISFINSAKHIGRCSLIKFEMVSDILPKILENDV